MKIALCFYGLVGSTNFKYGKGKPLNPNLCAKLYKKNFININNNVDIFIHSQSYDFKNKLINTCKPKNFLIEKKSFFGKLFSSKSFIKFNYFVKKIRF